MKKNFPVLVCAVVALLALAASGAAVAQSNMGNTATAGTTFTVGTVQSFGSDSVTILMDSGDPLTILLGVHTVGKQHLSNGTRVRIDYRNNEQGKAVAEEIEIGVGATVKVATAPLVVEAPVVVVQTTKPAETYRAEPVVASAPYVAEPATIDTPDTLPATASHMPGIALLGLLALAGGVALRIAR